MTPEYLQPASCQSLKELHKLTHNAEKEEQILKIRSCHCEDLVSLLGHFPNKKELEDWISSKSKEISSTGDKLTKLKMDLASNEQNKSHIAAELLKKELQLATDEERFLNVCSSRDLEQDMSNLQRDLGEIFKTKALLAGTEVVYTQFISELSEQREPCCPVCRRSFPSESEVQEVIRDLQSKLHLVPEKLKITEQVLERTERRREEIVALRPVREAIVQFQENELPALRKQLQTVDRKAERLKGDEEEQEALLAVLRSEEEKAKACLQDLSLMESYQRDLEEVERKIDQQAVKLQEVDLDNTFQQLNQEKQETRDQLDTNIEYIEIRSEVEERSEGRRSYNYKVVMMRGDADVDMRGHCSAGQKVLASLIIRLALVEVFCLDCGILALDEPTTNLDWENIESPANALIEIIKTRSQQRHFQLLIITHDEDFVQLLVRSGCIQHFYRISKNQDQNLEITKHSTAFLSV